MLLHRDATIVVLALGIAAALYGVSFRDLMTSGPVSELGSGIASLPLQNALPDPAAAGGRRG